MAELGTAEVPLGSNAVKYNDWFYGQPGISGASYPWCAAFLSWLFLAVDTGVDFPRTAACMTIFNYAIDHGRLKVANFRPGDVVIYRWNANSITYDHTGLVVEANGNNLKVLEGNYGDKVALVIRDTSNIIGAYRPVYPEEDATEDTEETAPAKEDGSAKWAELPVVSFGSIGAWTSLLQSLLTVKGFDLGEIDGDAGVLTETAIRKFQAAHGLDADGICGAQTWKSLWEGGL